MPELIWANLFHDYSKYDYDTNCINWALSKDKLGYGRKQWRGRIYLAHRLSMHLFGKMTFEQLQNPKLVVRHFKCDNPSCINLEHLKLGTQRDNIRDRQRKGRTAKHLGNRDSWGRFRRHVLPLDGQC